MQWGGGDNDWAIRLAFYLTVLTCDYSDLRQGKPVSYYLAYYYQSQWNEIIKWDEQDVITTLAGATGRSGLGVFRIILCPRALLSLVNDPWVTTTLSQEIGGAVNCKPGLTHFIPVIDYIITTTHSNVRGSVSYVLADSWSKYIWHASSMDSQKPLHWINWEQCLIWKHLSRTSHFYRLKQFKFAFMRQ